MNGSLDNDRNSPQGWVDFHTHILPKVDDGSRSVKESLDMIRTLASSGVESIALTPHFYARNDDPERFFARRNRSLATLNEALLDQNELSVPQLIVGAEVEYFEGITVMSDLDRFTLGDSRCLLLEMPMCRWATHIVEDVLELQRRGDCRIVLAHVERYLFAQKKETVFRLLSNGVIMQANASFFTDRMSSRRAMKLLSDEFIHVIGSDCHNMTTRGPNIGKACNAITKKLGAYAVEEIMQNARSILNINSVGSLTQAN